MSNKTAIVDDDVDAKPVISAKKLNTILEKAREQKDAENKVSKLKYQLEIAQKKLLLISQNELPKLMKDAGEDALPLGKGWSVELEKIVTASVPSPDSTRVDDAVEKNAAGVAYLRKTAPDLLRNTITIEFDLKEERFFKKVISDIKKRKKELTYSVKTMVNGNTLGAWVRKQDGLGKAVDEIALNVHRINKTKLVPPKKKDR